MRKFLALLLIPVLLLSACGDRQEEVSAPPRLTTAPQFPKQESTVLVPVSVPLNPLQEALERKAPRQLWSINKHLDKCVAGQHVKAFGDRIKVTPDISCQIVGQVTRGRITLAGQGKRITIQMPVHATIAARDVGGILKGKTATGSAIVRADVHLELDSNWNPRAKVDISYDWTNPPGIDIVGHRVQFVERADKELAKVIAGLERDLQAEIARAPIKPVIAGAWKQAFTVVELNHKNPPVWMRITPVGLAFAGYRVEGRQIKLNIAANAFTETFVGANVPPAEEPTPLPPQIAVPKTSGLHFFIPIVADYRELEPVVLRALRKLNTKGINIKDADNRASIHVNADFQKVALYATKEGRIAVGVDAVVEPVGKRIGNKWGKASGRAWLTGAPISQPNSEIVRVQDMKIFGSTDRAATNLLIEVANSHNFRDEIANALTQNFSNDYNKILEKAQKAIADRQAGNFHLTVTIDEVTHDTVQVTGAGLFMPVKVKGTCLIVFSPGTAKH